MRAGRLHGKRATAADLDQEARAPIYDWGLIRRLWRFVRPHRGPLVLSLLMLPVAAALNLVQPYLIKLAIDDAIVPRRLDALGPLAAALVAALLLERLARFAEMLLLQIGGQRAMHDLRVRAHQHLLSLGTRFFDRTPVGKLMTRVTNDVESITEAFSQGIISVLGDFITLGGIVVIMLWMSPKLALLTLLVVPALVLVVRVFRRLIRDAHRAIRRRVAQINATAQEHIGGVSVVQIFGQERRAIGTFDEANRAHRDAFLRAIRFDAGLYAVVEMLASLTIALLLWYGGLRVLDGAVTFGLLVAFIEYVQKFFIPIRDMSVKYMAMQQAMAASERVFALMDETELDGQTPPAAEAGAAPGASAEPTPREAALVAFDHVTFGYAPGQPVIRDVSLRVPPGQSVAVVGASGAGKSTLVKLLVRLYPLSSGRILLGGRDIQQVPLRELRRRVVVVSQDVFLFAGTVAHNIALGDPAITPRAVRAAAERVGLRRILALDRKIHERGVDLSAGERQLVAFARALVRDPELLVLDEATASVDPETEQAVQEGIAELMRRRTSIVIAHRLSTIEQVDRILVLHRGEVVERGRHADLLARGGTYSRLYELQYVEWGRL